MAIRSPFSSTARATSGRSRETSRNSSDLPISQYEFKRFLGLSKERKAIPDQLKSKFDEYLKGNSFSTYLQDTETANLFKSYVTRAVLENNTETLETIFGNSDSSTTILSEHLGRGDSSLEFHLFKYIQKAIELKKQGKDLKAEPIALAKDDDLSGLIKFCTDSTGLSIRAANLQMLQNSKNPIDSLMYQTAINLGLETSINILKKDNKGGLNTDHTTRAEQHAITIDRIDPSAVTNLLKACPKDGSLVYQRSGGVDYFIPKLVLDDTLRSVLGDDSKAFEVNETLNWKEFFTEANRLSVNGHTNELRTLLAKKLSLITAYYNAKEIQAGNDDTRKNALSKQKSQISLALQGRGLVPDYFAQTIRKLAPIALLTKEYCNRAIPEDLRSFGKKQIIEFCKEADPDENKITELCFSTALRADQTIYIPINDQKTFRQLVCIEKSDKPRSGEDQLESISLEEVVEAYEKDADLLSQRTKELFEVGLNTSAKSRDKIPYLNQNLLQKINSLPEKMKLSEQINSLTVNLKSIHIEGVPFDKKALQKSLKEYFCELYGIRSNKLSPEIEQRIKVISLKLSQADLSIENDLNSLTDNFDKLTPKNIAITVNKPALIKLYTNILTGVKYQSSLNEILDLDHISKIFDNSSTGKELRKHLQESDPFKRTPILDSENPNEYGELTSLLYAKTEEGEVDFDKRFTGLISLINTASDGNKIKRAEIINHIVDNLSSDLDKNTRLNFKSSLSQTFNTNMDTLSKSLTEVAISRQRYLFFKVNYEDLQREVINHTGVQIRRGLYQFVDKEGIEKIKPSILKLIEELDKEPGDMLLGDIYQDMGINLQQDPVALSIYSNLLSINEQNPIFSHGMSLGKVIAILQHILTAANLKHGAK